MGPPPQKKKKKKKKRQIFYFWNIYFVSVFFCKWKPLFWPFSILYFILAQFSYFLCTLPKKLQKLTKFWILIFKRYCIGYILSSKSWKQYPTKQQLYSHLQTIEVKWARHAGHCWRSKDKLIGNSLLWTPTYVHTSVSQPGKTLSAMCRH